MVAPTTWRNGPGSNVAPSRLAAKTTGGVDVLSGRSREAWRTAPLRTGLVHLINARSGPEMVHPVRNFSTAADFKGRRDGKARQASRSREPGILRSAEVFVAFSAPTGAGDPFAYYNGGRSRNEGIDGGATPFTLPLGAVRTTPGSVARSLTRPIGFTRNLQAVLVGRPAVEPKRIVSSNQMT